MCRGNVPFNQLFRLVHIGFCFHVIGIVQVHFIVIIIMLRTAILGIRKFDLYFMSLSCAFLQ